MRLLKIGRDGSCDIILHSEKVSSLHAEITLLNNGDILLEDKNSKNGTFIMNHPIKPGMAVNIKRGDAIRFGDVELLWNQVPIPENNMNNKAVYGIGTNFRNDIQVSGNTVSRFHATLKVSKDGKCYIIDHSKNGTTVNGIRISPNKPTLIKKSDTIICGGVPINITQFIPSKSIAYKILAIAASVLLLLGISYGAYKYVPWQYSVTPSTSEAIENASVCVYGGFYYEITIKDDPFKNIVSGWPQKWYIGSENTVSDSKDGISPIGYNGTAFFISKEGELGTNRHVAVPWKYITPKEEEIIREQMDKLRQITSHNSMDSIKSMLLEKLYREIAQNTFTVDDANAWLIRLRNSDIEISGVHSYFGIGSKVNTAIDLQQCQVIAESGDPKKDVALVRLNSRKTPDYIIKMGAIYDIEHARIDELSLKPQEEELTIVGYPLGERVSDETFDGTELRPSIHRATLSKTPDDNQIQIQAVGINGQSGSPVSDKKHRLVGVLCSGYNGTEVTFCCNIKHLVDLYNKNKVRA